MLNTDQLLQILILIAGGLIYWIKRRVDAQLVKVKSEAEADVTNARIAEETAKAHARQMEIEAELRKSEAAQATKLIEIIGTSIEKMSTSIEKSAETQARTVDRLIERLEAKDEQIGEDQAYVNEYVQRAAETSEKAAQSAAQAVSVVGEIMTAATELHQKTRDFMAEQVQRAVESSRQAINVEEIHKWFGVAFNFPDTDDCHWEKGWVKSRSEHGFRLWPTPSHTNQPMIGMIDATGAEGAIIQKTLFRDWVAVRVGDLTGWTLADHVLFQAKQPA